jgi:RHS repeat-associated protein
VTALAVPNGNAIALAGSYRYDPFGRLIGTPTGLAAINTQRYSSKDWHNASGFYYFGYRFYDPATQRWLNRDPIAEEGGVNLYGYVGNNPISGVDAFGLWWWDNDLLQKGAPQLWNDFWHDFFYGSNYQSRRLPPDSFGALHGIENDFNGCTASELVTELGLNAGSGLLEGLGALRFACTLKKCKSAKEASSIISKIEKLGGGYPRPSYTPKGAPQWIFPNGTVLRFDLKPGQYLKGQGPHINLEVPGNVPPNIHIPVKP